MSADRKLLEDAAKAAGMRYYYASYQKHLHVEHQHTADGIHWNPLADDGDALRLAVKLAIDFKIRNGVTWWDHLKSDGVVYWGHEPHGTDPLAATRRAIVRAAAELGRSKE